MANSKNLFAGLVKYVGSDYSKYTEAKASGKLIFAEITTGENSGKYIYANGVEYKVADATNLDALIARVENVSAGLIDLSTFVRETVNASVADLSTRMGNVETYSANVSSRLNDLSTYVHTEVDSSIDRLDSSVSILETWRSEHVDPSMNAFDSSLKDHETRITTLETNTLNALESAIITSAVASETATITLTTVDASGDNVASSVSVSGDNYVKVGGDANSITLTTTVGNIEKATEDASGLATSKAVKDYVASQISSLEQALVFRGEITASTAEASLTTAERRAGDTFVASGDNFTYNSKTIEAGDMVIVSSDSAAGTVSTIMVVERNLVGAVTSSDTLTADYIVLGNGKQSVKISTLAIADLITAIGKANSAVQTITADSSTTDFVDAHATSNASTYNVQVGVKTHDVSTAAANANGLATALGVKEYVDAQAADVKVQYSLNSSTSDYVKTSSVVDATGRIISSSVGVKVATLIDASNGGSDFKALADARDVYEKLTDVEETMAAANTAMATTIGLNDDYSVTWSQESGITANSSIVSAIEQVANKVATGVVTSFGGAIGEISVQGSNTNGDVSLWMDGSTLKAGVVGLNEVIAGAIDSSIKALDVTDASVSGQVVIAIPETDGKVAPERIQLKINGQNFATADGSMGAVINGSQILVGGENATHKDSSIAKAIADLSTAIDNIGGDAIKSVVGETSISGDGTYIAVTANENPTGTVTLASELTLAANTFGSTAATGLATDAFVKDYLAWEVISD